MIENGGSSTCSSKEEIESNNINATNNNKININEEERLKNYNKNDKIISV